MSNLIEVERDGLSLLLLPGEDFDRVMAAIEAVLDEQNCKPSLGLPLSTPDTDEMDYLDSVLTGLRDGTVELVAQMSDETLDAIEDEWIGLAFSTLAGQF